MSLPFETDLTEYARQCTLQRRRYEECAQAQQSNTAQTASTDAATQAAAAPLTETGALDESTEQALQGCVVDLLETSAEPLAWNGKALLQDASSGARKDQWHGDRPRSTQHATHSAQKNANPVSYSAP